MAAAQEEKERAAQLFGSAEAALQAAGGAVYVYVQDRSVHDQMVEAVRSRLDEKSFSKAWAAGVAMSLSEAVQYALSKDEFVPATSSTPPRRPLNGMRLANLTRREGEVAVLVARGLTNRQIASELSTSEHTVASHVAKTRRKLGLDSRSQIIAWIIERRTPP